VPTAGYSGTPLAKKLGLKDGMAVYAAGMPASVKAEILETAKPKFAAKPAKEQGAAHVFHASAAKLEGELKRLRSMLAPDGQIWVSWPKKAAKVETDITEDDETWSGLKLVIRKSLR
jgi:hypothetical protein